MSYLNCIHHYASSVNAAITDAARVSCFRMTSVVHWCATHKFTCVLVSMIAGAILVNDSTRHYLRLVGPRVWTSLSTASAKLITSKISALLVLVVCAAGYVLYRKRLTERNRAITARSSATRERDEAIRERNEAITAHSSATRELDEAIRERALATQDLQVTRTLCDTLQRERNEAITTCVSATQELHVTRTLCNTLQRERDEAIRERALATQDLQATRTLCDTLQRERDIERALRVAVEAEHEALKTKHLQITTELHQTKIKHLDDIVELTQIKKSYQALQSSLSGNQNPKPRRRRNYIIPRGPDFS